MTPPNAQQVAQFLLRDDIFIDWVTETLSSLLGAECTLAQGSGHKARRCIHRESGAPVSLCSRHVHLCTVGLAGAESPRWFPPALPRFRSIPLLQDSTSTCSFFEKWPPWVYLNAASSSQLPTSLLCSAKPLGCVEWGTILSKDNGEQKGRWLWAADSRNNSGGGN